MTDASSYAGIQPPDGRSDLIDTDYQIGQDNISKRLGPFNLDIHNPVFLISGIAVVVFVLFTLSLPTQASAIFSAMFDFTTKTFDWFFLAGANLVVIFALFLIVTPLGRVRLGGVDATPDYSYIGWFAMLFAAGMGIGLLFFGVSEPMSHFSTSLGGTSIGEDGIRTDWAPAGAAGGDEAAAQRLGMAATIFHWGLHPWAIYAVVALALALSSYHPGLPLTLRSAFYPLFGDRVWGGTGHSIDTLAVFATLFGLATSLGFGAEQTASGLTFLFGSGDAAEGTRAFMGITYGNSDESGVANNPLLLVLLITAITAVALVSVIRGLDGGVKVLSEINMGLAALLLVFVFFVGGPIFLITLFFDSIWAYFQNLFALS